MAKNPRLKDLTGQAFGLWRVVEQAGNAKAGGALWRCVCECGEERQVMGGDLRFGKSTNCGCDKVAKFRERSTTHGESGTRLHHVWKNMHSRCSNPGHNGFANYGGRGIDVCAEWASYEPFRDWARSNGYADTLTIERMDVDLGYSPGNCTWADRFVQARNRRFVRKNAEGKPWSQVAIDNGIPRTVYANRLHNGGWDVETAATWPLGKKRNPNPKDASGRFVGRDAPAWRR